MRRILLNAGSVLLAVSTAAAATSVAVAQEELAISGNVAFVTDYRFRGNSLSDSDPAVQGGFDLVLPSGFYVKSWASSIQSYDGSEMELDVYAGYTTSLGMVTVDGGLYSYNYPGSSSNVDYYEVYGSASTALGPIATTLGANYAWEQSNVIDPDTQEEDTNTYVYLLGTTPIGDSPFALRGLVGWEQGPFANLDPTTTEDEKLHWELGVTTTALGVNLGLSYIDTDVDNNSNTDGAAVFSVGKVF